MFLPAWAQRVSSKKAFFATNSYLMLLKQCTDILSLKVHM